MGARVCVPQRTHRVPQASPSPSVPRPPRHTSRRAARGEKQGPKRVAIVVLGDVGRSPRMQYHAMSLASHGVRVSVVGYTGERCISPIENNPRVTFNRFEPPLSGRWGKRLRESSYFVFAVSKALALTARLLYELIVRVPRPDAMLVQNPPSLPGLACVWFACCVRGCTMVLDWHNLGFTMFGRGPRHPLVWVTRKAEGFFGRRAGIYNITVSYAMRDWIKEHFRVAEAYIVYDKPPDLFRPPTLPERHALFKKLLDTAQDFSDAAIAHTATITLPTDAGLDSPSSNIVSNNSAYTEVSTSLNRDASITAVIQATGAATSTNATGAAEAVEDSGDNDAGPGLQRSGEGVRGRLRERRRDGGRGRDHSSEDSANGDRKRVRKVHGDPLKEGEERTPFTTKSADGVYAMRRDRPALLVSSTSWTPDEDFSVLLEALARFDSRAASGAAPTLPFVVVVVTGKGPEKARYVERMRAARMTRVALCTAWLEPDDYPLLLGSADLGISLHTSTSGVDLPMKVVDMFGCGVPVCAAHFECLKELVQDGHNGCVFKDSTQLALQLEALLDGFPRTGCELQGYRANVRDVERWADSWDHLAWPLFARLGTRRSAAGSEKRNADGDPAGGVAPSRGLRGGVVAERVWADEQRALFLGGVVSVVAVIAWLYLS